jgi:hypothetical protein
MTTPIERVPHGHTHGDNGPDGTNKHNDCSEQIQTAREKCSLRNSFPVSNASTAVKPNAGNQKEGLSNPRRS